MKESNKEDTKQLSSPRITARDTAYFPQAADRELKEFAAHFKSVPLSIIRPNPEICARYETQYIK